MDKDMMILPPTGDTFMGVPRDKIDWCPTVDGKKCNDCMECLKFCPLRDISVSGTNLKLAPIIKINTITQLHWLIKFMQRV